MAPQPRVACPLPGTPGAPYFDGRNISDFLDRYTYMCKTHSLSNDEKVSRLPDYCTRIHTQYITSRPEWQHGKSEWNALVSILKNRYRRDDYVQQMNTREYLEAYKSLAREVDDVEEYCRDFTAISENLIKREMLDRYTQREWFLQGLPDEGIVGECLGEVEFQIHGAMESSFEGLCVRAIKAARKEGFKRVVVRKRMGTFDPGEVVRRVEGLRPGREEGVVHVEGTVPVGRQEEGKSPPEEVPVPATEFATKEQVETLSEMIGILDRSLQSLMSRVTEMAKGGTPVPTPSPPKGPRADSSSKISTEYDGHSSRKSQWEGQQEQQEEQEQQEQPPPRLERQHSQPPQQAQQPPPSQPAQDAKRDPRLPDNKCLYCHGDNHRRYNCPDYRDAVARGIVHMNSRNRLSLGPARTNGPDLPFVPGQCQRDTVVEALKKQDAARSLSKPRGVVTETPVASSSSSSLSQRNESEPQPDSKLIVKPETQTETGAPPPDLKTYDSDSENERKFFGAEIAADTDTERGRGRSQKPTIVTPLCPSPTITPEETSTSPTDYSDLPSLAPCSTTSRSSDRGGGGAGGSGEQQQDQDQGLRTVEESIEFMRSMETVGVEEFSVRSKQQQNGGGGDGGSEKGKGKGNGKGKASGSGKKKDKKGGKNVIQGTVVNNGEEGIEVAFGE